MELHTCTIWSLHCIYCKYPRSIYSANKEDELNVSKTKENEDGFITVRISASFPQSAVRIKSIYIYILKSKNQSSWISGDRHNHRLGSRLFDWSKCKHTVLRTLATTSITSLSKVCICTMRLPGQRRRKY